MLKLSNDKFSDVQVGTTVRVPIPDVDRARGSPRNILAVVSSSENGLYKLCKYFLWLKCNINRDYSRHKQRGPQAKIYENRIQSMFGEVYNIGKP